MFSFLVVFFSVLFFFFFKELTGMGKRLGFAMHTSWPILSFSRSQRAHLAHGRTLLLVYVATRCYRNTQYRNPELAPSFVLLDDSFSARLALASPFSLRLLAGPPTCASPFIPPPTRWLMMALGCCWAHKPHCGGGLMKRPVCLTLGPQNGKSTPVVFLLSTALVGAEYTCSCDNVNFHERVVS